MDAPAGMTWLIIGLLLAFLVVVILFMAADKIGEVVFAMFRGSICNLPFGKC